MQQKGSVKQVALAVIRKLRDDSGWEEVMYQLYVREKIETGIRAATAGQTVPHDEVRRRFSRKK